MNVANCGQSSSPKLTFREWALRSNATHLHNVGACVSASSLPKTRWISQQHRLGRRYHALHKAYSSGRPVWSKTPLCVARTLPLMKCAMILQLMTISLWGRLSAASCYFGATVAVSQSPDILIVPKVLVKSSYLSDVLQQLQKDPVWTSRKSIRMD